MNVGDGCRRRMKVTDVGEDVGEDVCDGCR